MADIENTYSNCPNCGDPMWPDNAFCPNCGQKAYHGPPSFLQLMGEFIETVFSLDNRFFRTLKALLIPGRLTNEFLSGKQKPHFHPLRLFFVSGVLMVAAYSLVTTQTIGDTLDKSMEKRRAAVYENKYGHKLQKRVDSICGAYPVPIVKEATDSLLNLYRISSADSTSYNYLRHLGGISFRGDRIVISNEDFMLLTPTELVNKYEVEGIVNQYIIKQITRLNHLGIPGVNTLMGQAIWGLLLLVPLSAGLLKLIYIRHKRKYVEHFIFTLHTHAFLFLLQFLAALELLFLGSPWILTMSSFATVIYFLMAMKKVYKQGWFKTIIKATILSWGYLFLLPLAMGVAVLVAVLIF